jgi:NADPH-ferrihemoprotein reductase
MQGKNIVVFYGSQTGTAEEFSNRLAKDANRYGMKGMVADPEECEMVSLLNRSNNNNNNKK